MCGGGIGCAGERMSDGSVVGCFATDAPAERVGTCGGERESRRCESMSGGEECALPGDPTEAGWWKTVQTAKLPLFVLGVASSLSFLFSYSLSWCTGLGHNVAYWWATAGVS